MRLKFSQKTAQIAAFGSPCQLSVNDLSMFGKSLFF
ncbi:hypothetical protein ACP_1981 [Acidobacterium capsulatum ATCC 51196]|uniref:Uncharacterized protein n=1 Tax=Acidobacterium capsulatum (strain ATCC 51196 / DSM 11244 / BCRC 80197 / JCM 7670 / NBRC 15755 / NCIMB 13165 / 161) TaxID=240015 RepID=C1F8S7_ACIC5|nr:hypothetical protein ACP_1981 [Acidobacterium capsulatum ATCC 51196]